MTKEDEGTPIKCVFFPVYGDPIEVQKPINPGCECRLLKQYFLEHVFYIIHDLKKVNYRPKYYFCQINAFDQDGNKIHALGLNLREYGGDYCLFPDGPSGKPDVDPQSLSKHAGEQVVLTCVNPTEDGNPDCDIYTWNKIEGIYRIPLFATSKRLEFIMEKSRAGNYTCTCANVYGISAASDVAEVIFLAGPAPSVTSCRCNGTIII